MADPVWDRDLSSLRRTTLSPGKTNWLDAPPPMLGVARNLLCIGVTRGKRLVVLVGQRRALAIAVRNQAGRRRWTNLGEWLVAESAIADRPSGLAIRSARGQAVATASLVPGTR